MIEMNQIIYQSSSLSIEQNLCFIGKKTTNRIIQCECVCLKKSEENEKTNPNVLHWTRI